jgi:transposase
MANHSKKTPEGIRTLVVMHREGASAKAIAQTLGVSVPTAIAWIRDQGLEPNGASPSRQQEAAVARAAVAEALEGLDADEGEPSDAADAAAETVAAVLKNARRFSRIVERVLVAAEVGDAPPKLVAELIDAQRRIAAQLVELVPPAPPDPQHDPTNLQFAAETGQKFAALVRRAEEKTRCVHCGKYPHGEGRTA